MVVKEFHKKYLRDGIAQYKYGRRDKPMIVESQLRGRFIIEEAGSNLENRLAIIFRLNFRFAKF